MEIDDGKIIDRFFYGVVTAIVLLVAIIILGTDEGRTIGLFATIIIITIFTLGWVGEVVYEAYEEYL